MEKASQNKKESTIAVQVVQAPISVELFEDINRFGLGVEEKIILGSEAAKRARLAEELTNVFSKIGQNTLDSANQKGLIKQSEADQMFEDLADFILDDPNNVRLILYLPFQVFPDLNRNLTPANQKFGKVLHDGFIHLLHDSEPRCNFNDGDELEEGLGEPPRTRKIAHLLPQFIEKGIVSIRDTISLMEISDEDEMSKALFEGAIVANEQGMFSQKDWGKILKIAENKSVAKTLNEFRKVENEDEKDMSLNDIENSFYAELEIINLIYSNTPYSQSISKKRVVWEKAVKVDQATERTAKKLAVKLDRKEVSMQDLEKFNEVGIRAMFRYAEKLAKKDPNMARVFVADSLSFFRNFWAKGNRCEQEEITIGARRLEKLNGISEAFLTEFGIKAVNLSLSLPIDIGDFAENGSKRFIEAARIVENDPELSKYFYPFFLIFGSRIKGYAEGNGDFDMAIFVKPEVSFENRKSALSLLHKMVPMFSKIDKILEYWTHERDQKLGLKVAPENISPTIIGAPQIHFLFGGIWVGNNCQELDKLRGDLVAKYLDLSRFGEQKDFVRSKLLKQLEIDVLQYRLMHKGYRKNYPSDKDMAMVYGGLIDSESDFWDNGYRKVATQLFLKKVFLPDLS